MCHTVKNLYSLHSQTRSYAATGQGEVMTGTGQDCMADVIVQAHCTAAVCKKAAAPASAIAILESAEGYMRLEGVIAHYQQADTDADNPIAPDLYFQMYFALAIGVLGHSSLRAVWLGQQVLADILRHSAQTSTHRHRCRNSIAAGYLVSESSSSSVVRIVLEGRSRSGHADHFL